MNRDIVELSKAKGRTIYFIITLLVIAVTSADSIAQDTPEWSLDDCISYAHSNNISLKRQELNTLVSKKDYTQSKLNVLPNLGGSADHTFSNGSVLDLERYEWLNKDLSQGNVGIRSRMSLFSGLQGLNSILMSKANYMIEKSNLSTMENNITIQVMTGYLDLLRKIDLLEIVEEKVKITEKQVIRMQRMVDVGNASSGELLEVKAQHSTEKYNLSLATNNVAISKLNLVHLLNLDINTLFEIYKPELANPSAVDIPDLDTVYGNALKMLPQIKGAEYNIVFQEKQLAYTKGALSPSIILQGGYSSRYTDNIQDPFNPSASYALTSQLADNMSKYIAVGLSVPIFNRWQTNTNISKAKLGVQDAIYRMENEKQLLLQEIQQFYTDAVAALDNYNAAGETFANSEEAYRYTEEKFKVGMATALELEEARNRLFASQSEMISSKYVFIFYSKILDFYQGKEISLN